MPPQPAPYSDSSSIPSSSSCRRDRADAASALSEFDAARRRGGSQRAAAEEAGVPRSTLRYWSKRLRDLDLPETVAAILETPEGRPGCIASFWLRSS